jgi:hypothetical protein
MPRGSGDAASVGGGARVPRRKGAKRGGGPDQAIHTRPEVLVASSARTQRWARHAVRDAGTAGRASAAL